MQPVLIGLASSALIMSVAALVYYRHQQQQQQLLQESNPTMFSNFPAGEDETIRDDGVISSRPQQFTKVVPGYRWSYH